MNNQKEIILKPFLNQEEIKFVKALEQVCMDADRTALKLELDYKENVSKENYENELWLNEFYCKENGQVIGYVGICGFDGSKLEVNGMVHPDYRRQGIFNTLMALVLNEFKIRKEKTLLLLCDSASMSGQGFIQKMDAVYSFSEYEMYLSLEDKITSNKHSELIFRKATNEDALIIAKQNAIYFGKPLEEIEMPLPETEEKRGMIIFLVHLNDEVIGKVNIITSDSEAGIYGVGVLPAYRGKGYGRAIIEFAIRKSQEMNATRVMLQVEVENSKALNLYTACGFVEASKMDYFTLTDKTLRK